MIPLAKTVPGARLAYLLHDVPSSFALLQTLCQPSRWHGSCKGKVSDHCDRDHVRRITRIPIDTGQGICYARGFGCLLTADQHFSCFPYAIPRHRMAVCINSAVFPGFEDYVPVYSICSLYGSLYTVLYIFSTWFSILYTLYRYNKTQYILYTGSPSYLQPTSLSPFPRPVNPLQYGDPCAKLLCAGISGVLQQSFFIFCK
jgi:hypothetical protein